MYIKGFEHIPEENKIRFYICKYGKEILVNVMEIGEGTYGYDSIDEYKNRLLSEEEIARVEKFIIGCTDFLEE